MAIVVELVSRGDRVLERHKFTGERISIGRSYDNDLIITDPYVSAHHALVSLTDSGFEVEDRDSPNGIYLGRRKLEGDVAHCNSGERLTLGKTYLRLLRADHPVEPVTLMSRLERVFNKYSHPLFSLPLLLIIAGLTAFSEYMTQYARINYANFALEVLGPISIALLWAGLWALITRIFRHEPRFFLHLLASLLYLLALLVIDPLLQIIAFNTGSLAWTTALGYLLHGLASVALLALNLRFAFHQDFWRRQLIANGLVWSLVGVSLLISYAATPEFRRQPSYSGHLLPANLLFAGSRGIDDFLQDAQGIFQPAEAVAGSGAENTGTRESGEDN